MKVSWESIQLDSSSYTDRLSVPGGWLVVHIVRPHMTVQSMAAMAFVPDPCHQWGEKKETEMAKYQKTYGEDEG